MFKWAILFAMPFAILFGVLFGGSSASAASIYDGTVEVVPTMIIQSDNGLYSRDISADWITLIDSIPCYNDIQSAIQFGSIAISQGEEVGTDNLFLNGFYSTNLAEGATFTGTSPNSTLVANNTTGAFRIILFNDDTIYADCSGYGPNGILASESSVAGFKYRPFITSYLVDYPVGYSGENIPNKWYPPLVYSDKPDIVIINVVDWKITLQDRNFNTFDNVPFTCKDGLTPIIEYDLFNNDTNERINQGVFSPTIPYEYQTEKYGIETEYKFIGNYYCGPEDGQPTFSHQTTFYFTVTKDGIFIRETVEDCITATFPFVDINGCTSNLELLLNSLSFGAIKFPKWEFDTSGCHTLGTIGDWINVPSTSRTICPQFPSSVRNIVTPFVTFVIGATIIGAISTKSSRSNL